MPTITIELPDELLEKLRAEAQRLGLTSEQRARRGIEQVAESVLKKNAERYRRLSGRPRLFHTSFGTAGKTVDSPGWHWRLAHQGSERLKTLVDKPPVSPDSVPEKFGTTWAGCLARMSEGNGSEPRA